LYFQIQRALLEKIHSGELREGDLLTSEWKLARAYHVSRVTAREALHGLKASGYASSLRGRGTFVTKPKLEKPHTQLRGFTQDITQRGMVPSSRLLEQTVIDRNGNPAVRAQLELSYEDATKRAKAAGGFADSRVNGDIVMGDIHIFARRFVQAHVVAPGTPHYLQSLEDYRS
jgi:DNA-binding GntR family transcriptional regulator